MECGRFWAGRACTGGRGLGGGRFIEESLSEPLSSGTGAGGGPRRWVIGDENNAGGGHISFFAHGLAPGPSLNFSNGPAHRLRRRIGRRRNRAIQGSHGDVIVPADPRQLVDPRQSDRRGKA